MNGRTIGGLAISCVVLGIWAYLLLKSDDDPAALKTIAGCFASPETIPTNVVVQNDGVLIFGAQQVHVFGNRDKVGISLKPQRAVVIDRQDHNRLRLDGMNPLLLVFNGQSQTLEIPDYHGGPSALFRRVRCG